MVEIKVVLQKIVVDVVCVKNNLLAEFMWEGEKVGGFLIRLGSLWVGFAVGRHGDGWLHVVSYLLPATLSGTVPFWRARHYAPGSPSLSFSLLFCGEKERLSGVEVVCYC